METELTLTYLGYYTNIHIAATAQVIEDTTTDCLSYKFYSLLPLEDKKESVSTVLLMFFGKYKQYFDLQMLLKTPRMN
jgi:hypothetical protein